MGSMPQARARAERRVDALAHRLLYEGGDPRFVRGSQLLEREGDRPHSAIVELRAVVEAECRIPRLELRRGLEEADDLAVLGIGWHAVPGLRREVRRAGGDDRMDSLSHGAIGVRHRGDRREHITFPIRLARLCLLLLGALSHRGFFLGRESLALLLVVYSHVRLSFALFGA